ncbi:MAG: hypothetical protein ACLUJR_08110 [Mediterraneibacter gnavus]
MNDVAVDEEYGGGNWKDGVSALNFVNSKLMKILTQIQEHHITTRNGRQRLKIIRLHWMKTGVHTWVQIQRWNIWENHNMLLVAPGSSYSVPEADSNITTVRGQCKSAIVDGSWKMIFAKDDAEFNSLKKDMQKTAKGLGYDDVLKVDMKNAADQTAARKASAEKYPAESDAK